MFSSQNTSSLTHFLLILLPFMVVLVLIVSIVAIISFIWIISIIGVFLIAIMIPICILIIVLIVLSYLSGNILYFSLFFDEYSQKVFISHILYKILNYGVEDVYQLILKVLAGLKQYSGVGGRRRTNYGHINVFRVILDEDPHREEEFIYDEYLHNVFHYTESLLH